RRRGKLSYGRKRVKLIYPKFPPDANYSNSPRARRIFLAPSRLNWAESLSARTKLTALVTSVTIKRVPQTKSQIMAARNATAKNPSTQS
ncbi:MAG: hypothetical protein AAB686_00270, partial [Patescibacteria group bacterium]